MNAVRFSPKSAPAKFHNILYPFSSQQIHEILTPQNWFYLQVEGKVDIFKHYGVTTVMDHMFLATHREYYQQGIGLGLVAATADIARALNKGENVAVPISEENYPWKNKTPPKVQAIMAIFTSPASQKIPRSLGWDEIFSVKYDDFFYEGKSYCSRLDNNNETAVYMATRIDT
jgi:hypothetical protein